MRYTAGGGMRRMATMPHRRASMFQRHSQVSISSSTSPKGSYGGVSWAPDGQVAPPALSAVRVLAQESPPRSRRGLTFRQEHSTAIAIRQVKYLNNIVEQDHRAVKRITRPLLGCKSFAAAQDTLAGIELMHMIKKRQLVVEEGDEGRITNELFYSLAA